MLNHWFTPRFATNNALGHEQRICWFSKLPDNHRSENHPDNQESPEPSQRSYNPIERISEGARNRLQQLGLIQDFRTLSSDASVDVQRNFIEKHAQTLLALGTINTPHVPHDDEEVKTVISEIRDRVLEETMRRPEKEIPRVWFNSREDFEAAYIKSMVGIEEWGKKSLSKLRNEARRRGMNVDDEPFQRNTDEEVKKTYWRERLIRNDWHDATIEQLRKVAEKRGIDMQRLPTAFQVGTNIYFNGAHEDFRDQARRERSITHELTHFVLDSKPRGVLQAMNTYLQKNAERYTAMKTAILPLVQKEQSESPLQHNDLHELIAIYLAGKRHAFQAGSPQARISALMEEALAQESGLRPLLYSIDELGVQWKYGDEGESLEESIRRQFEASLEEDTSSKQFIDALQDPESEVGLQVHTNIDEDREDAMADLTTRQEQVNQDTQKLEPAFVLKEINYGMELVTHFRESLPTLKESDGSSIDSNAVKAVQERLSECGNRLLSHKNTIDNMRGSQEERRERMRFIRQEIQRILAPLEELAEFEESKKNSQPFESEGGVTKTLKNIVNAGGAIRWMFVYDMLKLFNVYKDAIANSYKSQQEVRVYGAARDFAPVFGKLPFGKPIEQILLKQARAANDEETSKFADYIKSEGFTYEQLLEGKTSVLAQNTHNVNRSKAIIEYAADHGWLYKMDKKNGHNVYGVDFIKWFGDHSFRELINRNESGKKKEVERGEERVRYHSDIPLIIEDIENELKDYNIYAVRGMLQILQNKAKLAESNTWGLMTLFQALKDNPKLREILEKGLIDNIGNIGIAQSAWSLTLFKMQRTQFMQWKAVGNSALKKPEFILAQTIQQIEDMIPENEKKKLENKTTEKNRLIGRVLAGQTVTYPDGTVISIFLDRFTQYRRFWLTNATSTEPGKTDDDFFNPDNGGSDVLLLPGSSMADILTRQSQGPYVHRTKAHNFLTTVMMREEDLRRNSPEAHRNYVREMKEKLNFAWKEVYTQDAACNQLTADKCLEYHSKEAIEFNEKNQLDEIFERGMLDQELYYRIIVNSKGLRSIPQSRIFEGMTKADIDKYTKGKDTTKRS